MTKKIFLFLTFIAFCSLSFAELADAHRYFEFGVDAEAGVSNNYFRASDILVSDVVIDLADLADDVPEEGLVLDMGAKVQAYFALDISKKFRFKLFWGADGDGYADISKSLFKLLGGTEANTDETIDIDLYADLFLNFGFSVKTDIKSYGLRITPSLFLPVLHVAEDSGYAQYTSTEDGLIRAKADVPVNVYSLFSLDGIKENASDPAFIQEALAEAVTCAGFDLALELEHQVTNTFDLGVFTNIPVVPGKLKYKASTRYYGLFEQTNFFGILDDTMSFTKEFGHDELTYEEETIRVNRPFKIGFEGAWRPFGDWCILRPKFNVAVRNPFSAEYKTYCEYGFMADFVLLNVIGLRFGTAYEGLVFKQTAGFMLNTRIVELNAAIQLRGSDFANSFGETGATAVVSLKMGF